MSRRAWVSRIMFNSCFHKTAKKLSCDLSHTLSIYLFTTERWSMSPTHLKCLHLPLALLLSSSSTSHATPTPPLSPVLFCFFPSGDTFCDRLLPTAAACQQRMPLYYSSCHSMLHLPCHKKPIYSYKQTVLHSCLSALLHAFHLDFTGLLSQHRACLWASISHCMGPLSINRTISGDGMDTL